MVWLSLLVGDRAAHPTRRIYPPAPRRGEGCIGDSLSGGTDKTTHIIAQFLALGLPVLAGWAREPACDLQGCRNQSRQSVSGLAAVYIHQQFYPKTFFKAS
jgi:hypothetical protein